MAHFHTGGGGALLIMSPPFSTTDTKNTTRRIAVGCIFLASVAQKGGGNIIPNTDLNVRCSKYKILFHWIITGGGSADGGEVMGKAE